jgi:probable HAF family extracellular repeat protein
MRKRIALVALTGVVSMVVGAVPAVADTTVTMLPFAPGSGRDSGWGVNDAGVVVGASSTNTAIRWLPDGTPVDLGRRPGDPWSMAYKVNNNGVAVGNSGSYAVSWSADNQITTLPGLPGHSDAFAYGLNDSGVIVGDAWDRTSGLHRAVRWNTDGMVTDLGVLPGQAGSLANAVNAAGTVVGTSYALNTLDRDHPVKWLPDGTFVALPRLADKDAGALGINDHGVVVGWSTAANDARHAVLWTPEGVLVDLGTLPGGRNGMARDINNDGVVVGTSNTSDPTSEPIAVWWDANRQIAPLPNPAPKLCLSATAISNTAIAVGQCTARRPAGTASPTRRHPRLRVPPSARSGGGWRRAGPAADAARDRVLDLLAFRQLGSRRLQVLRPQVRLVERVAHGAEAAEVLARLLHCRCHRLLVVRVHRVQLRPRLLQSLGDRRRIGVPATAVPPAGPQRDNRPARGRTGCDPP